MAKGIRQFIGTILKDLSKTCHYLPHGLLIAILGVYGFDRFSLRLLLGYLNSWKQRTKVGLSYNNWSEIKHGIPQGPYWDTYYLMYL